MIMGGWDGWEASPVSLCMTVLCLVSAKIPIKIFVALYTFCNITKRPDEVRVLGTEDCNRSV